MEYFAKMVYGQWLLTQEGENFTWGSDYDKEWSKVYDILNQTLATEIERSVNKRVWEVQENAFIAGFAYACKCLSDGKIDFGGANIG